MAQNAEKQDEVEILPPDYGDDDMPEPRGRAANGKVHIARRLSTVAEIKSEMGKIYRQAQRGRISWQDCTRAVFALNSMLKACVVEEQYNLLPGEEDKRPVFAGLTIEGLPPPKADDGEGDGKE